jgi:hypothetical protein
MRRIREVACTVLVLLALSVTAAGAASSPYPATLTMQRGLSQSNVVRALPWGTTLTAAQARSVTVKSSGRTDRWGVWNTGTGPEFPVRSTDGGARWTAAGPLLATDWAGGSIYYINKVIAEGSSAVVMVSNFVIDVSTDSGHQWYQYVNAGTGWTMAAYAVPGGGIGLRIIPVSYATLPKASYAIYVLNVAHHQWHRTMQSLFGDVTGLLVRVGGPSPGAAVGISGRVVFSPVGESGSFTYSTARNGTFAAMVPAGYMYRVTGYSPKVIDDGREEVCAAAHPVRVPSRVGPKGVAVVRAVEVVCPIK